MNIELEPFNLEKAKAGEPIQTRDGRSAKFIAYMPEAIKGHQLICLIDSRVTLLNDNGMYYATPSNTDIFMAPKPKVKYECWINVYKDSLSRYVGQTIFMYEDEAVSNKQSKHVATVRIEWEENV